MKAAWAFIMQLEVTRRLLPLVMPETERRHLRNLRRGTTETYIGNEALRQELRRMRWAKLIDNDKGKFIGSIRDNERFDLAHVASLAELGREWADEIIRMEAEKKRPDAETASAN
jgi:hypothetical protein